MVVYLWCTKNRKRRAINLYSEFRNQLSRYPYEQAPPPSFSFSVILSFFFSSSSRRPSTPPPTYDPQIPAHLTRILDLKRRHEYQSHQHPNFRGRDQYRWEQQRTDISEYTSALALSFTSGDFFLRCFWFRVLDFTERRFFFFFPPTLLIWKVIN